MHGAGLSLVLWRGPSASTSGAATSPVNRRANRCLAALTMVAALRLMPYVLGFAGAYDAYRWLTFAPFDFTLALGPLLWGYVVALTTGELPSRWRWHLVPAAVQGAYSVVCFALPTETKWDWYTGAHLRVIEPIGLAAVLASVAVYGIAAWRRYVVHQTWLTDNLSNRDEFRLGWLRWLLLTVGSTWLVTAGFFVFAKAAGPLDYFDRLPAVIWLAGLVYALGLAGWRYGARPMPLVDPVRPEPAEATTTAQPEMTEPAGQPDRAVAGEWAQRIEREGWWRDATLTRTSLASYLGTSPRTLSRVLNDGLGQSFNEFVNRLRVEAVKTELADGARDRDFLQIAFDAGFNSKASFNRAFKIYTGQTPSEFRDRARAAPPADVPAPLTPQHDQ